MKVAEAITGKDLASQAAAHLGQAVLLLRRMDNSMAREMSDQIRPLVKVVEQLWGKP